MIQSRVEKQQSSPSTTYDPSTLTLLFCCLSAVTCSTKQLRTSGEEDNESMKWKLYALENSSVRIGQVLKAKKQSGAEQSGSGPIGNHKDKVSIWRASTKNKCCTRRRRTKKRWKKYCCMNQKDWDYLILCRVSIHTHTRSVGPVSVVLGRPWAHYAYEWYVLSESRASVEWIKRVT